ncbi:MAG: (2Fe-2S) ferredoxin domain-containing protein [Candidatus Aureabacteria bacterium]|nr:(2Fe-2S) ferredoxin domain-containing protein [Candidatus Auribacterota bacterium]
MSKLTLDSFKNKSKKAKKNNTNFIKVGLSTCGIAAGADTVFNVLKEELKKKEINVPVLRCGCAGMCYAEPLVEVKIEGMPWIIYGKVNEDVALKIIRKHVARKQVINDYIFSIKDE